MGLCERGSPIPPAGVAKRVRTDLGGEFAVEDVGSGDKVGTRWRSSTSIGFPVVRMISILVPPKSMPIRLMAKLSIHNGRV